MGRCPHCFSINIQRYKTYLWKCLDCGQIFSTPAPLLAAPADPSAATGETEPDGATEPDA